jgi:hypothetical protein
MADISDAQEQAALDEMSAYRQEMPRREAGRSAESRVTSAE